MSVRRANYDDYPSQRPVLLLLIIGALVVVVVGLVFGYMNLSNKLSVAEFDTQRATLLVAKLEQQVNAFDSKLQTTETRVTTAATTTAAKQATNTINSMLQTQMGEFAKANEAQTWTAPQVFQPAANAGAVSIAPTENATSLKWTSPDGTVHNQISAGAVDLGDQVLLYQAGYWDAVRKSLGNGYYTLGIASNVRGDRFGDTPIVVIRDNENTQGILILGQDGVTQTRDEWRTGLYTDKLLFGPPGFRDVTGLKSGSGFDAGISRDNNTGLLLLMGGHTNVVSVGEHYFKAEGQVILQNIKSDSGDPQGEEGMIYINRADKAIKMYADGAWRTLASW